MNKVYEEVSEHDITHPIEVNYTPQFEEVNLRRTEKIFAKHIDQSTFNHIQSVIEYGDLLNKDEELYKVFFSTYNEDEIRYFNLEEADGGDFVSPENTVTGHIFKSDCDTYAPLYIKIFTMYEPETKQYLIVTEKWISC